MEDEKKTDYQLLLISEDSQCVGLVRELFSSDSEPVSTSVRFDLSHSTSLAEACEIIGKREIDVVLLDEDAPAEDNRDPVSMFLENRFDVPLVVLTGSQDDDFGVRAVEKGAQDYLKKSALRPDILRRSILYAFERNRLIRELKRRALIDDLTGLYNRRGFFYLGEHTLSLAERNDSKQFIMFADLDGLKIVNDTRGHEAGDRYIVQAAEFLRKVFRESDIIARIGGDEFAVIAQAVSKESIVSVRRRFDKILAEWNKKSEYSDELSLSIGIVFADNPSPRNLDHFLASADHLMYRDKARKK